MNKTGTRPHMTRSFHHNQMLFTPSYYYMGIAVVPSIIFFSSTSMSFTQQAVSSMYALFSVETVCQESKSEP